MRVLIFGTMFADTKEKADLAYLWIRLHEGLNRECDLLLVDSASPYPVEVEGCVLQLGDNIGHLSKGGKDGWGRAFCAGLRYAIKHQYDYVVHIEGDSLCSLNVMMVCSLMQTCGVRATGVPVRGMKRAEKHWMETGLMFLDVGFIDYRRILETYNWQEYQYKQYPQTPEFWLRQILGDNLCLHTGWKTIRDDRKILTVNNVHQYDWITHTTPEIFNAFAENVFEQA